MKQKVKGVLNIIPLTISFWITYFLGPILILLVGYFIPGSVFRASPGSIAYYFSSLILQPMASYFACTVADKVDNGQHTTSVRVNAVVAVILTIIFLIFRCVQRFWLSALSMALTIAALLYWINDNP